LRDPHRATGYFGIFQQNWKENGDQVELGRQVADSVARIKNAA
jgi:hypothetical protein